MMDICVLEIVKPSILESRSNWRREIIAVGSVDEMLFQKQKF